MIASLARIYRIIWKEVIQIRRDRRMFGLVLLMPVMELFIFGYVVSTDIDNIDLAVCDYSHSAESRAYVDQLERSGYFRVRDDCAGVGAVNQLLDRGRVRVALAIPPDFAERLKRRQPAQVMAAVDGSNSNTAMIASSYLEQITLTQAVDVQFPGGGGQTRLVRHPLVAVEPRVWFNPELRSVKFMVPGIICVLLMESLVILTAIAIVKEKERGTMEQLIVTPIRSYELIIGKAVPFIGVGYLNVAVVILVGTYWFDVAIRGSLPLLLALSGLFILTCLGMGLVVSTISNTQQQASMAGQFVILPSMFFSGFMFPIASMPPLVQKFTYLIPLRYYIAISRGIFLKGAGWAELWDEAAVLAVYGVLILGVASTFFRKQIR
ncbi:MAG: ABC transporter permease [Deltaproteobacteria bacterium]|nr:ABC transporter permease [Deltaproteobacteria bacterium]MBI3390480.1 ABC transporter permease [Deltaproteobacteria bacterium]